ncbi:MAG: S41 family peptidase [Candidatus Methanomethylicia archaeon]
MVIIAIIFIWIFIVPTIYLNNYKGKERVFDVVETIKTTYYQKIDSNDLVLLTKAKNLKELTDYLSFLEKKYHRFKYDYLGIFDESDFEIKERMRFDNGIEKNELIVPGSPAMKICYFLNKEIRPQPEYYKERKADICFRNKNAYIVAREIDTEIVKIIFNNLNDLYLDTIVLDLRSNPGGGISEALSTIALITGEKIINYSCWRKDTIYNYNSFNIFTLTNHEKYKNPKFNKLIIYTDKRTASAAEFITFKLKEIENEKVEIINQDGRTADKKTVLIVTKLNNNISYNPFYQNGNKILVITYCIMVYNNSINHPDSSDIKIFSNQNYFQKNTFEINFIR